MKRDPSDSAATLTTVVVFVTMAIGVFGFFVYAAHEEKEGLIAAALAFGLLCNALLRR